MASKDDSGNGDAVSQPHIRAKVRHKRVSSAKVAQKQNDSCSQDNVEELLENTRQRIESWYSSPRTGVVKDDPVPQAQSAQGDALSQVQTETNISNPQQTRNQPQEQPQPQRPASILRKPKYSSSSSSPSERHPPETNMATDITLTNEETTEAVSALVERSPVVKDRVVEREAPAVLPPPPTTPVAALDIEGHRPQIQTKKPPEAVTDNIGKDDTHEKEDDSSPLIFSSLSGLLGAAGMLPDPSEVNNNNDDSPNVIEADLEFSCMTPEDFQQYQTDENSKPTEEKKEDLEEPEDDDEEELSEVFDDSEEDDYDDDEDVIEEAVPDPEPRAFMKLWEALTSWVSPEAVTLIGEWKSGNTVESPPQADRTDVGASRCAGIMAMLNMHLTKSLAELGELPESKRQAQSRLADLLRTFDYSQPTPKLGTRLWRAMTCVLLDIALFDMNGDEKGDEVVLPPSAAAVGLTRDEYRYLVRSALPSLGEPSSAVVG